LSPRLRARLLQLGSALLGGVLLYLALRPVEFSALADALRAANYWYLVPIGVIALLSHIVRAWRWMLLLETLPTTSTGREPHLRIVFYSVMIGYMVNYAAPRLGEVARAGNLAAQSNLTFSSIFGSVVSERILDVLTLGVCFIVAFAIAAQHVRGLGVLFEEAAGPVDVTLGTVLIIGGLVLGAIVIPLLIIRHVRRRAARTEKRGRLMQAAHSFADGLASLIRSPRRIGLVVSTVLIWLCYWVLTYLPLPMLGITELGWADAWVLLVVGSIGMMVPAPGGIGSYHYVTIQTMTVVLGVGIAAATAFAVLMHGAQLILYVAAGFVCLLLQGRGLRVTTSADEVTQSP